MHCCRVPLPFVYCSSIASDGFLASRQHILITPLTFRHMRLQRQVWHLFVSRQEGMGFHST